MKPSHYLACFAPFFCALAAQSAQAAADATWNGTTDTAWTTSTNWSSGVPAAGDNIIIANTTINSTLALGADRTIGFLKFGTTGTRTAAFTMDMGTTNTLTLNSGITASGSLTASNRLNLSGNVIVAGTQDWNVGGTPTITSDSGLFMFKSGSTSALTLNYDLTKTGTGQLTLQRVNMSGAGNFIISSGVVRMNAGNSEVLTLGGSGNIQVKGTSEIHFSKNSGSFNSTRNIVMSDTAKLSLTGGSSSGTIASNIQWTGTHSLDTAAGFEQILSGAFSGAGVVNRSGSGALLLSGNSATFTARLI